MHVFIYILHYIIARAVYDELVSHGVAPVAAFLLAGALLWLVVRRRNSGRGRRWQR